MHTIWKHLIPTQQPTGGDDAGHRARYTITAPPGAVVKIDADPATGQPAAWIEHPDAGAPPVEHHVWILGTGWAFPPDVQLTHSATILTGPYVWHFYLEQ